MPSEKGKKKIELGLNISLKDRSGPYRYVKTSISVPNDFCVNAENTDLSTGSHMRTYMSMSGVILLRSDQITRRGCSKQGVKGLVKLEAGAHVAAEGLQTYRVAS